MDAIETVAATGHASFEVPEFTSVTIDPDLILRRGRLDTYSWHKGRDYFALQLSRESATLQARGFVGIIPINDRLTLEVTPRVPLRNLARVLELSGEQATPLIDVMRSYDLEGEMQPSLVAIYAAALRQQVESIVARGFYREYARREETTSFPHGRIDLHRTITQLHARAINHKASITYFQRTIDNPLNQCLLYAVWRLHFYLGQVADIIGAAEQRRARRDLNIARLRLQGVTLDQDESFLADPLVRGAMPLSALRGYYRPALELALTIIGGKALAYEKRGTRLELPSLLINMSSVFESYTRALLQRAAKQDSWEWEVLDGNRKPPTGLASTLFDREEDVEIRITPDTVFRHRESGDVPVLMEVKYRPPKGKPKREDLEQALTYGLAYRARHVVLLQPQGKVAPINNPQRLGTIHGMSVYRYLFDLGSSDVESRERSFVAAMRQLGAQAAVAQA